MAENLQKTAVKINSLHVCSFNDLVHIGEEPVEILLRDQRSVFAKRLHEMQLNDIQTLHVWRFGRYDFKKTLKQANVTFIMHQTIHYVHPLPFGRICFVVLVMRKGGESSWSGPWHLGCTSEFRFPCAQLPGPVHTARLGRVGFI